MALPGLKCNDSDQEHRGFADTLGMAEGLFNTGKLTKDTSQAYYAGHELKEFGETWDRGMYHLKIDCAGKGKTANGRSRNRVIIRIGADGKMVEGWAVAWGHDDRLLKLDEGFFKARPGHALVLQEVAPASRSSLRRRGLSPRRVCHSVAPS